MEGLSGESRFLPAAVKEVPQEGPPQVGEMDPDLVGPSGMQDQSHKGEIGRAHV